MKNPEVYLKEYCLRLSDENLKFLFARLTQRLGGDLGEVLDFLGNVREIDRWLSSAETCDSLYDMIDLVHSSVVTESERRISVVAA
jgi:hypothetical protein